MELDFLILSDPYQTKLDLIKIRKIVKIYKTINFKCDFIDDRCIMARKDSKNDYPSELTKLGCCCSKCAENYGYLRGILPKHINRYKKRWNDKTGFFVQGKGCSLLLTFRSVTCLEYVCNNAKAKMSQTDKNKLAKISDIRYGKRF